MKEARREKISRRKNFLPTLFLTILLWLSLSGVVYFMDPDYFGSIFAFFAFLFLSLFFTFSTIFANTRRGFLSSFSLTLFAFLRYFGIGNLLNLFLILGLAIVIEIYFTRK